MNASSQNAQTTSPNTDATHRRVAAAARAARAASGTLARIDATARSQLLRTIATKLGEDEIAKRIGEANARDMSDAREAESRGDLDSALVRRLELTASKLQGLRDGLEQLARMPEAVGARQLHRKLDEGLVLERLACPLGVLGVVFEARPDAVVQIAGLAIKTGNAVLLKGGSEALRTNRVLTQIIREQLQAADIEADAVTLLEDRAEFGALLACDDDVDLIIARGSGRFVQHVMDTTQIPVMGHAEGLCHLYLHADADPQMAAEIAVDAKTSYPAACNAIETLLWHSEAGDALDAAVERLAAAGVELRGCPATLVRHPNMTAADERDWSTEYTAMTLSLRAVESLDAALAHVAQFGSKHTEAIVSADPAAAERFLAEVDAAGVFWNASTRFADGFRYGLGAEVGVSTQKLHARGPVGIEGLLTYRYVLRGQGHVSGDYGAGKKAFLHTPID